VDVNCDSQVTSVDSVLILQYTAGMPQPASPGCPAIGTVAGAAESADPNHPHGDVDCNSVVDARDALALLTHIAAGGVFGVCQP
jgi:hypothetical protein